MKNKINKPKYPNLEKLGVKVIDGCVNPKELNKSLKKNKMSIKVFDRYFGIQTCPIVDNVLMLYAWDCEDVLTRILENRLIGSQLFWD
jgi:hypothetical protein